MKESFYLIDQLIQQGVEQFCIAPGTRSAPLVLAAARHPLAKTMVHFDERGLAFFALGYGKKNQKPAAIITTSGSAVGNLLPAVMESFHSNTPLILLTADRPAELRDCGANQTTDQFKLFSSFTRFQMDLPPDLKENAYRSIAAQSYFHATHTHPGPVQLNVQIRNPFEEPPILTGGKPKHMPSSILSAPPYKTDAKKGLILVGNIPTSPAPILALASKLKWPVCADILSNIRNSSFEEIRYFDWIIKEKPHLKPDFVLHFGERLTSKAVLNFPVDLHVSPYPTLQDPNRSLHGKVQSDITSFCKTFDAKTDPTWLLSWKEEERKIHLRIEKEFETNTSFTESLALRKLAAKIPKDHAVYFGSSMPIRLADHFFYPPLNASYFCNRGLSGIDGNIATIAGLAMKTPVIAFIGDQTALYDLNSLPLLKKCTHPVTLIISNNFGGSIFTKLPLAKWKETEEFMIAPHAYSFKQAAEMFDIPYRNFEEIDFTKTSIIELVTSREENDLFEKKLWNQSSSLYPELKLSLS